MLSIPDHVCNLSIHGQHLFLPQTCSRHGRSCIYELSWHCTWLVEILDPGSPYISIYVFSIFADEWWLLPLRGSESACSTWWWLVTVWWYFVVKGWGLSHCAVGERDSMSDNNYITQTRGTTCAVTDMTLFRLLVTAYCTIWCWLMPHCYNDWCWLMPYCYADWCWLMPYCYADWCWLVRLL